MKKNSKVYQIITEHICNLLKQGEIPWQHPWKTPGIFSAEYGFAPGIQRH